MLTTILGISALAAEVMVSAIGIDMSRFQAEGQLISWAGLCPRNDESAGKRQSKVLELSGTIVTIDAMGCQKSIAQQILDKEADYVLAVKENQLHLLEDVRDSFKMLPPETAVEELDCGHGRVETRRCSVVGDLSLVDQAANWPGLQTLVRIEAERYHKANGKTEREIRYYISSLRPEAARLNSAIRQHWGIENKLHWVLDVAFREDASRKRAGNAAQNFSRITHIALNLLKNNKTSKLGMKGKRLKASWDNNYLLQILGVVL
jgi:predicted transposase YbfD/YdcC